MCTPLPCFSHQNVLSPFVSSRQPWPHQQHRRHQQLAAGTCNRETVGQSGCTWGLASADPTPALLIQTASLPLQAQGDLPAVPWQPSDLLRVMGTTTAAGALFAAANMALRAQLDTQLPSAAATLDSSAALFDSTQLTASAVQHASQEALLALLFPAALWAALDAGKQQQQPLVPSKNATHPQPQQSGPSIDPSTSISPPQHGEDKSAKPAAAVCEANDPQAAAAAAAASTIGSISSNKAVGASPGRLLWCHMQWQGGAWLPQTLLVCAVVFPLADPLLSHAWRPVAEVSQHCLQHQLHGPAPALMQV